MYDPVHVPVRTGVSAAAGLVDRSNRGVLKITGKDRLSWLHSLTTQHLDRLAVGQSAQALILSPTGHVEHHLTLTDDGTAVWLHVEPGTAADLVAFLESMRFMLRVEVADLSADAAVLTVMGPGADITAGLETVGLEGVLGRVSQGLGDVPGEAATVADQSALTEACIF